MNSDPDSAYTYESRHVHAVYDSIASHFSQTRYKPWPIVARFLRALPPGSVGLDVGCGNGKYLSENGEVFIVGSDMSGPLLRLARRSTHGSSSSINSLVLASTLSLPHPRARFDFAICIAVVHHLSTRERRVEAVREMLVCLKPLVGRVLIYVWALEQKGSRRGWDEGDSQDVMVPWVLKTNARSGSGGGNGEQDASASEPEVYQRYYHLYRRGELEEDVVTAGGKVLEAGYEKDNWWVVASRIS